MSDPQANVRPAATSSAPPRAPRPRALRRAVTFALIAAATGLVQAVNAIIERRTLGDGIAASGKYMSVDQAIFLTAGLRDGLELARPAGVAILIIGVGLAYPLLWGRRWARILLWITGAILIISELILTGADSAVNTGNYIRDIDVPGGDPATVAMINHMLLKPWFLPVHYLTEFITFACLVAACIYLALPSTSDYFRMVNNSDGSDPRVWSVSKVRRDDQTR
jgi:hypothetical protein